jgi:WD40 repeat protein
VQDAASTNELPWTIEIRDLTTADVNQSVPTGGFSAAKWSPDGLTLAWTLRHTLYVWRIDADEVREYEYSPKEISLGFSSLAWQPDGRSLILGDSYPSTLVSWDAETETFGAEYKNGGGSLRELTWSSEADLLAVAANSAIGVWDITQGKKTIGLEGHRGFVSCVSWSPDGKKLISSGEDNLVRVWDVQTGRQIAHFAGHTAPVSSIDWAPTRDQLLSGSDDGAVRIWRLKDQTDAIALRADGAMAWHPTGELLVTNAYSTGAQPAEGIRQAAVLDPTTGRVELKLDGEWVRGLAFAWSPDGRLIAAAAEPNSIRDRTIVIWDAESGRVVHSIVDTHLRSDSAIYECRSVSWSPDGKQFASCGRGGLVKIWKSSTGELLRTLEGHHGSVGSALWSPDGRWFASAEWGNRIRIWDAEKWTLLWDVNQMEASRRSESSGDYTIAWSPDSARLATRRGQGGLGVWALQAGKQPELVWSTRAHTSTVRCVAWNTAGNRIATFSNDGRVKIWNAETGRELLSLDVHKGGTDGLAWSPDGRKLASGNRGSGVLIWDASRAYETPTLP